MKDKKTILMSVLFVVSASLLVTKFLNPTSIHITIQGEQGPIDVGQIFSFTSADVAMITLSAFLLGISSFYLLFSSFIQTRGVPPASGRAGAPKPDAEFALRLLDGDKRKVFNEVVEAGGEILQKDLPLQTKFSKAKITRVLDNLEKKGVVDRKPHGMTNKIVVNKNLRGD